MISISCIDVITQYKQVHVEYNYDNDLLHAVITLSIFS